MGRANELGTVAMKAQDQLQSPDLSPLTRLSTCESPLFQHGAWIIRCGMGMAPAQSTMHRALHVGS